MKLLKNFHPRTLPSFVCIAMLGLLVSCNKTDEFSDLDRLTGKDWHLQSRMQGGLNTTTPCDLDNVLRFTDASNFIFDAGIDSCGGNTTRKTAIAWRLTDGFTILRMKYKFSQDQIRGSMIEYWEINQLNDTALVVIDKTAENSRLVPEILTYR